MRGEAERFCGSINGLRLAFEFEKYADGCFIQVQVQTMVHKTRSEFFVAEGGSESKGRQSAREGGGCHENQFAFGAFFVARTPIWCGFRFGRRWALAGEDCFRASCWNAVAWGRFFGTHANQPAAASEIGMWSIEERIPFQNTSVGNCPNPGQAGEN